MTDYLAAKEEAMEAAAKVVAAVKVEAGAEAPEAEEQDRKSVV